MAEGGAMRESGRMSFEAWARSRQQGLVRTAYLLTGDFHRAEDLVQEALVKAAARWDSLAGGSPDAWVRTVVYRDHVSWWRRHRREVLTTPREVGVPPVGEDSLVLREALGRLTGRQRAVLVLRYVEDLSLAETAEVLGVSVGSVKKHASVAIARLRQIAPELEELVEERR
jgi:RNA polymerase sigma-70 factor (sigma-E family)